MAGSNRRHQTKHLSVLGLHHNRLDQPGFAIFGVFRGWRIYTRPAFLNGESYSAHFAASKEVPPQPSCALLLAVCSVLVRLRALAALCSALGAVVRPEECCGRPSGASAVDFGPPMLCGRSLFLFAGGHRVRGSLWYCCAQISRRTRLDGKKVA